jgi:vesicle coat complex subunit
LSDPNCFYRYASEVDVDFVRKSVRAIGRCAIKIEEASERCINVLLDLINTGINYVVQEAIVVIKASEIAGTAAKHRTWY